MGTSTYGLAPQIRAPRVGGPSLMQVGDRTLDTGMSTLGAAAEAQTRRDMTNQELKQQGKAGMAQLGSTIGSTAGFMVGGPVGAMLGGSLGALAGSHF